MKKFFNSGTSESAKRLVGITCSAALILAVFIYHTSELYYCLTATIWLSLGLTTIEKVSELITVIKVGKTETKTIKEESSSETIITKENINDNNITSN